MTTTQTNSKKKSSSSNGVARGGPGSGGMPKKASAKKKAAGGAATADRDKKLSPVARAVKKMGTLAKRFASVEKTTTGWTPKVDVALGEVKDAIVLLAGLVTNLPIDFKPPSKKGGSAGAGLAVGTLVDVTEKAKEKYVGILEDGEWTGLKVVLIASGKVRCKTSTGGMIVLPRAHVAPQPVEETDEEEEEAPASA